MDLSRLGTKFECMNPNSLKFLIAVRWVNYEVILTRESCLRREEGFRDHYQDNHDRTDRKADGSYANTALND